MAAGNTGALSLFDLNATVSLSAEGFTTALEGLQTKITDFSGKVQNVITKIGNFEHGLSAIGSNDATGIENVTTTLSNLDEAAVTAYGSVAELDDSVSNASASADIGATKWERFAHSVSTAYGAMKKVGTIAWDVGSGLVQSAASWENQEYLFGTVFGDEAGAAQGMLDYYSEMYNIHERRLKGNMVAINRQLTSAEVDPDKKFTYTTQALQVATVAASAYGTTIDDATSRLLSFMRGNVEAGETIGLFTNQLARENIAAELYGTSWDEISEAQREIALLTIATRTMSEYQNVPIERANSYANALQNLQVQWEEVRATLGAPILNAVTPVIQELSEWLEQNPEAVQALADAIGAIVGGIAGLLINISNFLQQHPEILSILTGLISRVPSFLETSLGSVTPQIGITTQVGYEQNIAEEYGTSDTPPQGDTAADIQKFQALAEAALTWDHYGDMGNFEQAWNYRSMERDQEAIEDALATYFTTEEVAKFIQYLNNTDAVRAYGDRDSIWRKNEEGKLPNEFVQWVEENFGLTPDPSQSGLLSSISDLPNSITSAITAALPSALAGVGVYMDSQLVGHLVSPTVMGDMARSARNNMHTGTNT